MNSVTVVVIVCCFITKKKHKMNKSKFNQHKYLIYLIYGVYGVDLQIKSNIIKTPNFLLLLSF